MIRLRDYDGALADYSAAIARLEKGIDRRRIGRVQWDRGRTRMKLGQDEEGCADYNRAIEMGFKMWIKVEGQDDAGSVTDRPELSGEYRSHPVIPRGDGMWDGPRATVGANGRHVGGLLVARSDLALASPIPRDHATLSDDARPPSPFHLRPA